MRQGSWLKARPPSRGKRPFDAAVGMHFHRPGVDADGCRRSAPTTGCLRRSARSSPSMRRVSRMPTCGAISTMADCSKPGTSAFRKRKYSTIWRRPSTSPSLSSRASTPFIARPCGVADLRDVGAPFARVDLRPQDRALARKAIGPRDRARARASIRSLMALNSPTAASAARRIDMADAEHGGREQPAALAVADLERHAGEGRDVGVAAAIDEGIGADRLPARLGLHHQRGDARAVHQHRRRPAHGTAAATPASSSSWSAAHL